MITDQIAKLKLSNQQPALPQLRQRYLPLWPQSLHGKKGCYDGNATSSGQDSAVHLHLKKSRHSFEDSQGHRGPLLEPDLVTGHTGEHLVAGSLSMESGWAQPKEATWDPLPVGSLEGFFSSEIAGEDPPKLLRDSIPYLSGVYISALK
ncbi:hypothetical protein D4764_09G0010110 [Takifugu flavidus]|uniref:Uncharacterized protein n=1 Tax=Takifugu flavidus TaxID=433684 RepID=A0A5C6MP36_9TELE|nr:hypothetical protein D4764_09G0010110 [Takifugu flavidus]